jgi:hypothetical protein
MRFGRGRWRAPIRTLFLDAKVEKVRDGGRVVNNALVIAAATAHMTWLNGLQNRGHLDVRTSCPGPACRF